jgi:GNAT superfamily N-acetyltransferase
MRKAWPDDVEQLVALMAEFYAEGGYPLNDRRAAEAFTTLLADERLGQVWFIQADSQTVGHVVVTLCFSMEYGGLIAFVDDLFIQRPFRRMGLGAAALTEVCDFCAKRGVRAILVETGRDNAAAQAVYRRVGFVNTDRQLLALTLADPTHVTTGEPTNGSSQTKTKITGQSGS